MFGIDLDSVPQLKDAIAIAKKTVSIIDKVLSNTDALEGFRATGRLPIKMDVYDYHIQFVLEDRRKTSLAAELVEVTDDES